MRFRPWYMLIRGRWIVFTLTLHIIPEQQTAFGLSCLPIYERHLPGIMQEVRGLADGLGQRYEAVF